MIFRNVISGLSRVAATAALVTINVVGPASAAELNIPDAPLFLNQSAPPLNLLVMGRDHKLYYEAYNDASDLNNDGVLDVGYKPNEIDYYGYFDSYVCYTYSSNRFIPDSTNPSLPTDPGRTKKCPGKWSGDFLNYLTMTRMDALRKVLYGGLRTTDGATGSTILRRAYVPQDAHSWGKEYEGIVKDGYDIRDYTPLALPALGTRHLFANATIAGEARPQLRYRANSLLRVWNWVTVERPQVAGGFTTSWFVDVQACVSGKISAIELERGNCRRYPDGGYKPVGLLQKYGENDRMLFGLLTGSYFRNTEGGVLRKNVGTIANEIVAASGQFDTGVMGVIRTIDRLQITGYNTGDWTYNQNCGWITTRPINAGECRMWGNPVGEMMYEALRYFAGKSGGTSAFLTGGVGTDETTLGLPAPAAWVNPFANASKRCAKPFMTVVSDINPSFDTNSLPGTSFGGGIASDLAGLNVTTETNKVGTGEAAAGGEIIPGTNRFIGESIGNVPQYNNAPSPKSVQNLGTIRGLAPEEPTKQGGYYSAGLAYWGNTNDVNPALGRQRVQTFSVAIASPLPRIEVPFGDRVVTLVPFAKSIAGSGIDKSPTAFQPTNTIVDFYYDRLLSNPPNRYFFRINFEDVEQGADHDMDAIVEYDIQRISDTQLSVTLNKTYQAGGITHHIGYIISGTENDGIYLEVRDDNGPANDDYFLDTPPGVWAQENPLLTPSLWQDGVRLPEVTTRVFTVGKVAGATLLKDPLWYAAKWGGFVDSNNNNLPDKVTEWNQDGDAAGTPDNYFLVTNALNLSNQLSKAFDEILKRATSASSVALNSGSLSDDTRIYQAKFNSDGWVGQLLSYTINADGSVPAEPEWDAAQELPAPGARTIITRNSDGTPVPFRWGDIDSTLQSELAPTADGLGERRLDFLRGASTYEVSQGGAFRNRPTKLGDIVASSPVFVGPPRFRYRDSLESKPYSAFRAAKATRKPVVYAGANDGMLHGFLAGAPADGGGKEVLGYIPREVVPNLHELTKPDYAHRFYVDGSPTAVDAFVDGDWRTVLVGGLGAGGRAVYALDVTDPATFSEGNADEVAMWEFDDDASDGVGDADLGLTYSRPIVVRLANGKWAAVFGNGYNSKGSGTAVLYVVDLEDGSVIRKIDTGVGVAAAPAMYAGLVNGLSSPTGVDANLDDIVDYVYAGDLYGNMWKFSLKGANPAGWGVAYEKSGNPAPIFTATNASGDPQPITSRPSVGRGPRGIGLLVLFGTGRYLDLADKDFSTLKLQSFYGLYDRNSGTNADVIDRDDLFQQSITREESITFEEPDDGDAATVETSRTLTLRVTTDGKPTPANRGWYMDLKVDDKPFAGEMQVSESILRSGRVLFTTLIPSQDSCSGGGEGWLMSLDAMTGGRLARPEFDLNDDGVFDELDQKTDVPSGIKSELGIVQRPGVLADNPNNQNFLFVSGTTGENPCGVGGQATGAADSDSCAGTRTRFGPFDLGRQSWRQVR